MMVEAPAQPISLIELRFGAREAANLVTVLDLRPTVATVADPGLRSLFSFEGASSARGPLRTFLRRLTEWVDDQTIGIMSNMGKLGIGAVTITAAARKEERQAGDANVRPSLTATLISAAHRPGRARFNYADWADKAARKGTFGVRAIGPAALEPLFRHRTRHMTVVAEMAAVGKDPAWAAVDLANRQLARLEERNELSPPSYLEMGLALVAADRAKEALPFLRTARNSYEDPNILAEQRGRRPELARMAAGDLLSPRQITPRAWRGSERAHRRGETLRNAHALTPEDPRIGLYLALAIHALVKRQSLAEAAALLQAYLDADAPLGRRDEVEGLLAERAGEQ
jgi:hypothetical protein